MDIADHPGAAVRIRGGQYDGFIARVLGRVDGDTLRVAVVLFRADHEITVPFAAAETTDEDPPRPRVVRILPSRLANGGLDGLDVG